MVHLIGKVVQGNLVGALPLSSDRRRRLAVLVPAVLLAASGAALAQKTAGAMRGTVYDDSGAIVTAATIRIQNQDTGYAMERSVDSKGEYSFPLLQPGNYRIEVTAAGFKKYIKQDIVLRALETVTVTINLEIGPVEETLVVTADPDQVNVSSGGVAHRLDRRLVSEFPSLNRYGFANAALLPSVSQYEERRETINASVAGAATNRNNFYIDGAEATDPWRGWSPRQPLADAFEEIVVSTAGATPDVGSNFGGVYNAVLKSGTNTIHGGAWYYFRDKSLNANSWVNNYAGIEKPDDPLKYWGAQVGGPIVKDKAFFYGTVSRETDETSFTLSNLYAPTEAMVGGDFSAIPFTIHNPDTGQPFQGNVIPQSMLDPVAVAFWEKYGYTISSYGPTRSFQFADERKVWNYNGRLDLNLDASHRLTLSGYYIQNKTTSPDARVYSITRFITGNTFGDKANWGELSDFPQTVLQAKHTWMVKPNIFVETHGSWSNMPEKCVLTESSLGTTLGTLGANDTLPRPDAPEMLPSINIGTWFGNVAESATLFHGWTTDFTVKNINFGTSMTWISGSHNIKVGAEFQSGKYHTMKPAQENNVMLFNGNATSLNNASQGNGSNFAYGFADFMLGRFSQYQVADKFEATLQSWNLAGYIMDQWRVTPRLTITPGLRYDINSGITEKDDRMTLYRPGAQSALLPNAPPGILVAGDSGVPRSLSKKANKLAPRFNVAYDLTGDGKTAVRGSAGLYYGRDVLAIYDSSSGQGFINKPPFVGATAVARDGRLSDPWLTSQNPTYSAVPFPFTDQDPANFSWPSQVTGILGIDPDYSIGSSWQWNIAVEREILKGVRLDLGYQGNRTNNEPIGVPSNTAEFRAGATSEASNIQARRPNQFLGDVGWVLENAGRVRYDQIMLIARVRRSDLFGQLSWAYTHSRRNFNGVTQQGNRDWDGGINSPDYPNLLIDFQNNHAVSGFFVWNLPLLKNNKDVLGKVLGGWSVTADGYITFLNKGVSVFTGYDTNANGNGFDLAEKTGSVSYPKTDLAGQQDLICQWFDGSAYGFPGGVASGEFTNVTTSSGANSLATPGAWSVNSALLKNFGLTENAKLQVRFEVYNLFNHANLNGPTTAVNSADFGRIRGKTGDGRRIQLGARLQF